MERFNHLIMSVLMLIILLSVNQYMYLAALINLLFNCLMIVCVVVYMMQFLGVLKPILPTMKIFN